jgi:hypothetical protein
MMSDCIGFRVVSYKFRVASKGYDGFRISRSCPVAVVESSLLVWHFLFDSSRLIDGPDIENTIAVKIDH